jgi:hypothetical protein
MCENQKKSHTARFDPDQQLGKKFKIGCLWAVHNILIHPLMSVADCLHGVTKVLVVGSEWLHDKSAPGPLEDPADLTEDEEAEVRQLEDEVEAMEDLRAKPVEDQPDVGDLPDKE